MLRPHYQHIVIQDFLKRVADPAIVDAIVKHGNHWCNALAEPFFMPLEFAVAAYRFGHTMVRAGYNFNLNFPDNKTGDPRAFIHLHRAERQIADLDTLPDNWIIEWENIIGSTIVAG